MANVVLVCINEQILSFYFERSVSEDTAHRLICYVFTLMEWRDLKSVSYRGRILAHVKLKYLFAELVGFIVLGIIRAVHSYAL